MSADYVFQGFCLGDAEEFSRPEGVGVSHSEKFLRVLPNYRTAYEKTWKQVELLSSVLEKFYRMYYIDDNTELVEPEFMKTLHKLDDLATTKSVLDVRNYLLRQDAALVAYLLNTLDSSFKKCTVEEIATIMCY